QEGLKVVLPENKLLSILKLSQLLNDKKYVELARDKFNFTIRDFYRLQSSAVLYDKTRFDALSSENEYLKSHVENLNNAIDNLQSNVEKQTQDIKYYEDLVNHKNAEIDGLNSIINHKHTLLNKTVEYRAAKLIKKVLTVLRHAKHFLILRDKKGKKYRKSVMLYGFYGMNLGDDLFFEKLLERYPNTMFLVYCFGYYRPFFEKYNNVKFYAYDDPLVLKIRQIGDKFKITDLFELLLLKRSSATVHIGGSIYQQIGDYELDYKLRLRRKQRGKPFYSISCNFGAYKTEEFKNKWGKQFKKFKDVCFRDKYSYELFSKLKGVRNAPDLLFSYKYKKQETLPESVAISVFNPFASHRSHSQEVCQAYLDALAKTVCDLVKDEKKVSLLGFCTFEGDGEFIEKLLNVLPDNTRDAVKVVNYSFDSKDEVLNELAVAEYIIGTRLHSCILGLVMGKKVLPIAYNQKIHYILGDISYDQPIVELDDIVNYKDNGFADVLKTLKSFDVSEHTNSDNLQFAKLDKFLN
ncbi:MAG: polysaccharide pyruvyl transferase family protein, partial [Clostridia bacterium]|nr:polysaccharide pyruvyl transferase family protein [Clostridia bacterium]